jgi:hypothetical protein
MSIEAGLDVPDVIIFTARPSRILRRAAFAYNYPTPFSALLGGPPYYTGATFQRWRHGVGAQCHLTRDRQLLKADATGTRAAT